MVSFTILIRIFFAGSDFDDSDDSESDDEEGDNDDGAGEKKSTKKKKSKDKDKEKKSVKSSRRAGEASGVRAELQSLKSQLPGDGEDDRQYPISVVNDRGDTGYRVEVLKEFYRLLRAGMSIVEMKCLQHTSSFNNDCNIICSLVARVLSGSRAPLMHGKSRRWWLVWAP